MKRKLNISDDPADLRDLHTQQKHRNSKAAFGKRRPLFDCAQRNNRSR
jgi:hypothetical protein